MKPSKLSAAVDMFLATDGFELVDYSGRHRMNWEMMEVTETGNEIVDSAIVTHIRKPSASIVILYFIKADEFGYIISCDDIEKNRAFRGSSTNYLVILNMVKMIDEYLELNIFKTEKQP